MRVRRTAATTAVAVAVVTVLAAAVAVVGGVGTAAPASAAASPHQASTLLLVQVQLTPSSALQTWFLRCDPVAGFHPDPDAACAALDNVRTSVFQPVPAGAMCTQIYGGPERAWVLGRWRGRTVWAMFTRTNGCEIARWNALGPLLQPGRQ